MTFIVLGSVLRVKCFMLQRLTWTLIKAILCRDDAEVELDKWNHG